MELTVSKEQEDLLKTGSWVRFFESGESNEIEEEWFFLPYWFKKDKQGNFEIVPFEKLPERFLKFLKETSHGESTSPTKPAKY